MEDELPLIEIHLCYFKLCLQKSKFYEYFILFNLWGLYKESQKVKKGGLLNRETQKEVRNSCRKKKMSLGAGYGYHRVEAYRELSRWEGTILCGGVWLLLLWALMPMQP